MARICSVQSGDLTYDFSTGASITATISSIDTSKSFLVYTIRQTNGARGCFTGAGVTGALTSSTQVTFYRQFPSETWSIRWYVVTFSSGMSVQRGSTSVGTSTVNVTLTDLGDTAKCWAIQNSHNNTNGWNPPPSQHTVKYDITSTTNLALISYENGAKPVAYWQVVKYTSCSVQKISKSFTTGTTGTSTITSVTLTKSFINLTGRHQDDQARPDYMWHAYLTDATTLTYERVTSDASTAEFITYVVSFTDKATCGQYKTAITANQQYKDVTVSLGQTGSTWPQGNNHYNYSCGDAAQPDNQMTRGCYTPYYTSTTNIRLSHSTNGTDYDGKACNYYWDLIEHTQDEGGASVATKMYHYRQMKNRSII